MTYNPNFKVKWLENGTTCSYTYDGRKSYMIYRTAPFSMTLNDPYPGFMVTPFFDAEYLRKKSEIHSFNGILIRTYTRPTQHCISNDPKQNIQWHEASRGLSPTAELLVDTAHARCCSRWQRFIPSVKTAKIDCNRCENCHIRVILNNSDNADNADTGNEVGGDSLGRLWSGVWTLARFCQFSIVNVRICLGEP